MQAPHGMGRKARRGGLAKGSHMAPGLMRKQKGGLLRRESSGISAALVCGNSLGTLIQALHAHEHKVLLHLVAHPELGSNPLGSSKMCIAIRYASSLGLTIPLSSLSPRDDAATRVEETWQGFCTRMMLEPRQSQL